jgi:hypothetical protein
MGFGWIYSVAASESTDEHLAERFRHFELT